MSLPTISIVTPCLNAERHLRETVQSVLTQDYPAVEYIIVDGGSTDGSAAILADLPAHVIRLGGPDEGQSDAINKGLRRASGEILAWLNASDLYPPSALRKAAEYFRLHPEAGTLFGRARLVGEEGEDLGHYPCAAPQSMMDLNGLRDGHLGELLRRRSGWIPQPAAFWRRETMTCAGLLDATLHYAMDYDYWIRLGRCAPIHFVDAELGIFRIHRDAKSRSARRQWEEVLRINRRHGGPVLSGIHAAFLKASLRAALRRIGLHA